LDVHSATKMVRTRYKETLTSAFKNNFFGFKYSKPSLFCDKSVDNELTWKLKHVFISGLDKAANNAYFICISHIRCQTLARLNGPDFASCCNDGVWQSLEDISSIITTDLAKLILELPLCGVELPYIMTIYKFHKKKYRWISNAFGSVYVNIATLLTVSTMTILEEVKEWAYTRVEEFKWLTTNCFVRLGDRVWKQILGIPMRFSCSPLWCNLVRPNPPPLSVQVRVRV
jgi:hypothetical protein